MFSSDMTDILQMSAIFGFMKSEYHEAVVKRALDARDTVSKEAQGSLNSAINETAKVPQFPNYPAKAPTPFLLKPVLKATMRSDRLTAAILKVWAESHDSLGSVVSEHLSNMGMPVEYPDFAENRFRSTWFCDAWMRETNKILKRHGEFEKDDVALMLCYASGKIPGDRETKDDVLSQSLNYLRFLPPNAPEWEQEIPEFIETLNAIQEKKEEQRGLAIAIDDAIDVVVDDFSAEMAFFQQDAAFWSADQLPPDADFLEALQLTEKLQSSLTEYRAIREIAPIFPEEQLRRAKREALEQRILPMLERIDRIMAGPDDDFSSGMDNFDDSTGDEADRPDDTGMVAEESSSDEEERQTTNEKTDEQPLEVPDDVKSEVKNGQAFSEEDYKSENQRLQEQVKSVHRRLDESQAEVEKWKKDAERWRGYYIDEVSKRTATAGEDEDLVIEKVNDAVELAQKRYEGKLLFQLNGKSRVKDNPYEKPKKVYKALKWLGSDYHKFRLGKIDLPDLDVSIRQACGWWYKEWQGKRTVKKLPAWYTTKVEDETYRLHRHIGTGSRRDARYTIRIAFTWDEIKKRVVIGFIGQHQKTFAT